MKKNKITILSTKELAQSLIDDAATAGIDVEVRSFIDTAFITSNELDNQLRDIFSRPGDVAITSMKALEAVTKAVDVKTIKCRLFCIGHATHNLAQQIFGSSVIAAMANNAKELAQVIIASNSKELIFICGDLRRTELPDLLTQNQIGVKEVVVYRTVLTPQKIENDFNGILFFSPSAVQSFFLDNAPGDETILFAIGNTTAAEIRKYLTTRRKAGAGNKIIIADIPDKKNLFNKMTGYFQQYPANI